MRKKGEGLFFLLLVVVLLVIISSRNEPMELFRAAEPTVTDDPLPTETPASKSSGKTGDKTENGKSVQTAEPRIQDILPGVSSTDWNLRLVNNVYILTASFAPDVVKIGDDQYFSTEAAEPLQAMIAAAEEQGFTVSIRAAYRPFSTQAYIFNGKASQIQWGTDMSLMEAETEARKVVAYPGTSEHQLGLAVDLMDSDDSVMDADTAARLPLLIWLKENCAKYGFILRYPEDKQSVTGWYEPWHFRYVGEEAAAYIMDRGLCLEEFIDLF